MPSGIVKLNNGDIMNHPYLKEKLEEYTNLQNSRNEKILEVLKALQSIVTRHAERIHKLEENNEN